MSCLTAEEQSKIEAYDILIEECHKLRNEGQGISDMAYDLGLFAIGVLDGTEIQIYMQKHIEK